MAIIALTTDFGLDDWFAGTMKGVILGINPKAIIVDISHGIPPGDVRAGAFALAAAYRFFPKGTVHVAVVDPGVGSERKAIAVRTKDYLFVGPDNGLLSWALAKESVKAIHRLENKTFFLPFMSQTFQGRDVFAPVAAHLSKGVSMSKLGPRVPSFRILPRPAPTRRGQQLVGEVIYIDRFGNAITNISRDDLALWGANDPELDHRTNGLDSPSPTLPTLSHSRRERHAVRAFSSAIRIKLASRKETLPLVPFYQSVLEGRPLGILGSAGFLEISINGGSAARKLCLRAGDRVILRSGVASFC